MPSPVSYGWVTLPKALCKKAPKPYNIREVIAGQEPRNTYLDAEEESGADWSPSYASSHEC